MDNITVWLEMLKEGDEAAAQKLWEQYYGRLVSMAQRKLNSARRDVDGDDIAQSAFKSFFMGVRASRFPQLDDRDDLWKVLFTITARKLSANRRRQNAQKRGGSGAHKEQQPKANDGPVPGVELVEGDEPSAEELAIVEEAVGQLLSQLPDDTSREVAVRKMEGYANREIADLVGCVPRTVERKLKIIREIWTRQ